MSFLEICRTILTFLKTWIKLKTEHLFVFYSSFSERGNKIMTENENNKELIKIIRENDNPEQALMTATVIILDFLKQHESSEGRVPASPSVLY